MGNVPAHASVPLPAGAALRDKQTGLRGVHGNLLTALLVVLSSGDEFELDRLIVSKHQACPIREEPIRTIYGDGNRSSHFNPPIDSGKIYFVQLRLFADCSSR